MNPLVVLPEVVLDLSPFVRMTPEAFAQFCAANPDLVAELNPAGEIELMSPTGFLGNDYESILFGELYGWWKNHRRGTVRNSTVGLTLPNGAIRSPDVSWFSPATLAGVPPEGLEGFPTLVPDFVAEIRSASDRLPKLQAKLEEYRSVGVLLGWLLDPANHTAWVYRPGAAAEAVDLTAQPLLDGAPVLPGFVFDTRLLRVG